MHEFWFVFIYGALFLVGAFLGPFWATVAVQRADRVGGRWTLRSDRYFVLASALAVLSFGDTVVFGARALGNMEHGPSAILRDPFDGIAIGFGLLLVFAGKVMLVWLADLEKEPPVWTWTKWGSIITVGWAAALIALQLFTGA